jgi:hypothetical protein
MDGTERGPGTRWRPAGWRDPRLLIGILLVVASVVGVGWMMRSAQKTTAMWSAAVDLPVGKEVTGEDLVAVQVRLGASQRHYLSADSSPSQGARVLAPISKGELIPAGGLGTPDPSGRRAVSVTVQGTRPAGVVRGSRVDVYATSSGTVGGDDGDSRVLLPAVEVTRVRAVDAGIGTEDSTLVEVLVPPDQVADFIRARGAGDRLDVVALPPGSTR